MKIINEIFEQVFIPRQALVIYQDMQEHPETFVESYDIDEMGKPRNGHPLTVEETKKLSASLISGSKVHSHFLQPEGILPFNVLFFNVGIESYAIWYTLPMRRYLYFNKLLGIPCGKVSLPSLIWKADREHLHIFSFKGTDKPTETTPVCHAPFFNVYASGMVCMGTVDINVQRCHSLESFISMWEDAFFNSYFTHSLGGHKPVKGNIVNLYNKLATEEMAFPQERLIENKKILADLWKR